MSKGYRLTQPERSVLAVIFYLGLLISLELWPHFRLVILILITRQQVKFPHDPPTLHQD